MPIVGASGPALRRAAAVLQSGGLVAFPTETVYGLGAVAFRADAVARVFEVKGRPAFDPLIVHVADRSEVGRVAAEVPPLAQRLMDRFWPGPLTLVLPRRAELPPVVTAGLETVAVRLPAHPVALELIRRTGAPLAAPSANRFGCASPTEASHVEAQLGGRVELILDAGPCAVGVESTVVFVSAHGVVLLRPGGVPLEEIEAVVGRVGRPGTVDPRLAPGQLERHYAPRKALVLVQQAADVPAARRRRGGLLAFGALDPALAGEFAAVENLSARGDVREAAARLFAALHRLDAAACEEIFAVRVPDRGLGRAVVDRLQRAARR